MTDLDALPSHETPARRPVSRRALLGASVFVVLLVLLTAAYFLLRPGYKPLFTGLKPRDAGAVIAELEKQKIPFRVEETTGTVLVPERDARAARVKLMAGSLRLAETVGLELFDDSDLGLTDFAQKVNYQRALQGELARTIMSLDEVEMARVHLTLPESSLFRSDRLHPKASVAIFVRPGEVLRPNIVRGIQLLIAAAVPDLSPGDVAVLDAQGVALTASTTSSARSEGEQPHALEQRTADRVATQLRHYLPGANVAVTAHIETMASPPMPLAEAATEDETFGDDASGSRIARITLSAVVDRALDDSQRTQALQLMAATAGLDTGRGDSATIAVRIAPTVGASATSAPQARATPSTVAAGSNPLLPTATALVLVALAILLIAIVWSARLRRRPTRERALAALRQALIERRAGSESA